MYLAIFNGYEMKKYTAFRVKHAYVREQLV